VELAGAVNESALIKAVQWDMFGSVILHVDLTRAQASELVETVLAVELKGEAIGLRHGGIIEQPLHTIRLRCPAGLIPDKLTLSVNGLDLGGSLVAGQIPLPAGGSLLSDPDEVVVHCIAPVEEAAVVAAGEAEPEVIGRKKTDEEQGDESSES
jgi:large subunit ribosomal protein L25